MSEEEGNSLLIDMSLEDKSSNVKKRNNKWEYLGDFHTRNDIMVLGDLGEVFGGSPEAGIREEKRGWEELEDFLRTRRQLSLHLLLVPFAGNSIGHGPLRDRHLVYAKKDDSGRIVELRIVLDISQMHFR